MTTRSLLGCVIAAVLVLSPRAGACDDEAKIEPNTISGTVRFNNPPGPVRSFLESGPGLAALDVTARTTTRTPALQSGTSAGASGDEGSYEVIVNTAGETLEWRVFVSGQLDPRGTTREVYEFLDKAVTVSPLPAPGSMLDFDECAGVIHATFSSPVHGGSVRADSTDPSRGGTQAYRGSEIGPTEELLVVRGAGTYAGAPYTGRYDLSLTYRTGTDPFHDLLTRQEVVRDIMVPCDAIVGPAERPDLAIKVTTGGGGGGSGSGPCGSFAGLGCIVGRLDVIGHDELVGGSSMTVAAERGPSDNSRYDIANAATGGAFELENLPPLDAATPGEYEVSAKVGFGTHAQYEAFWPPKLANDNPLVPVRADQLTDLALPSWAGAFPADPFVIAPGTIRGEITLKGPPADGSSGPTALQEIVHWYDDCATHGYSCPGGDGVPRIPGDWPGGTSVGATGTRLVAPGAHYTSQSGSASVGLRNPLFDGHDTFTAQYDVAVGGLAQEDSIWECDTLDVSFGSRGRMVIVDRLTPGSPGLPAGHFLVEPGGVSDAPHRFCVGEVRVHFTSTDPSTLLFRPVLAAQGGFTGIDAQGEPADYVASADQRVGIPYDQGAASSEALAVMVLPEGRYTVSAYVGAVRDGTASNVTVDAFELNVGCGQVIDVAPGLQLELAPLPECSTRATMPLSGHVVSGSQVVALTLRVDDGAEVAIDGTTPALPAEDPTFAAEIDVPTAPGSHRIAVTATDEIGRTSTVTAWIRFDATPPVIEGCEDIAVVVDHGRPGANVDFDVHASDVPDGTVPVDCTADSGSFFAIGEHAVTCTAADSCGNHSECRFTVSVTDNGPPQCDAGPAVTQQCDGVTLEATASDPDGDALTFHWTSSCPGTVFSPSADVEDPVVTFGSSCAVTCDLTLGVDDGRGGTCSDLVRVDVDDTTAPVLTCPADAIVQCDAPTDPSMTGAATATDNCDASPVVTYSDAVAAGRCPQATTITRTWTATDACANRSSCVQTITVVDTTAPAITCPKDLTLRCDEPSGPSVTGSATAEDNCDLRPLIAFSDAVTPGRCPQSKTIARTWTATDACGNRSTCVQTITVVDSTPPVATALLDPVSPLPSTPVTTAPTLRRLRVHAGATDACDARPTTTAMLLVTHHDVPVKNGPCVVRVDEVSVVTGEVVEVRLLAPPCPAKPPKAPQPSVSVSSAGIKVITGERVVLRVTATDACGNTAHADHDPTTKPSPPCDERLRDGTCCPAIGLPPPTDCKNPCVR